MDIHARSGWVGEYILRLYTGSRLGSRAGTQREVWLWVDSEVYLGVNLEFDWEIARGSPSIERSIVILLRKPI